MTGGRGILGQQPRLDFGGLLPAAYTALVSLEEAAADGLETALLNLVCVRAAQINGCAYSIDAGAKEALYHGESSERLFLLPAWREAGCYTRRERAALAFTDAVTLIDRTRVPDDVWEAATAEFEERDLAALLATVVAANAWNRICLATRRPAGDYRPW